MELRQITYVWLSVAVYDNTATEPRSVDTVDQRCITDIGSSMEEVLIRIEEKLEGVTTTNNTILTRLDAVENEITAIKAQALNENGRDISASTGLNAAANARVGLHAPTPADGVAAGAEQQVLIASHDALGIQDEFKNIKDKVSSVKTVHLLK